MPDREGIARLTRVAKVAPPAASAGLMPPPLPAPGYGPGSGPGRRRGPPAPPPHATLGAPTGVAKLTPRAAAAESMAGQLRSVMGRFATGVTVVTTRHRDTIHGMTANGFMSVSLRPALVLVSLGRCRMSELLPRSGCYGVSVLAADQEHLAAHFAGQRPAPEPPEFESYGELPLLAGALAHVGCEVIDVHPAGDHILWIGRVTHLHHRDGEPLLFYSGRFGTLGEVSDRTRTGG